MENFGFEVADLVESEEALSIAAQRRQSIHLGLPGFLQPRSHTMPGCKSMERPAGTLLEACCQPGCS